MSHAAPRSFPSAIGQCGVVGGIPRRLADGNSAAIEKKLPAGYVAAPRVHAGSQVEIDVAAYEKDSLPNFDGDLGEGGVATAIWAPAAPTVAVETELPDYDEYEVRIYDARRKRRLVAAIEIVSPANKDRLEHRNAFIAKCHSLLQQGVAVSISIW